MAGKSAEDQVETRLSELLAEHREWLRRTVASLCPRHLGVDPEEIEQEVRLRLWRALERGTEIRTPPSYLYRAASCAIIDAIRRLKARREDSLDELGTETAETLAADDPGGDPRRQLERLEHVGRVREALATLMPNRRRAVALHLQGFDTREIGRLLDWTEPKARNLVSRGMQDLRKRLAASPSEQ